MGIARPRLHWLKRGQWIDDPELDIWPCDRVYSFTGVYIGSMNGLGIFEIDAGFWGSP